MSARNRSASKQRRTGEKTFKKSKERLLALLRHPLVNHPATKGLLIAGVVVFTLAMIAVSYAYLRFARLTDEKLAAGPISNSAMVFGAPRKVAVGDEARIDEIVGQLRASGYTESRANRMGWYNVRPDAVEIFPGKDSFAPGDGAVIKFAGRRVSQIISLRDNTERTEYLLEPELLTNLFDRDRKSGAWLSFRTSRKTWSMRWSPRRTNASSSTRVSIPCG